MNAQPAPSNPPPQIERLRAEMGDTFADIDRHIASLSARGAFAGPSRLMARLYGLTCQLPLRVRRSSLARDAAGREIEIEDPAGPVVTILDAGGEPIALINPLRRLGDDRAHAIAELLAMAVNAAAGAHRTSGEGR